MPTTKPHVKAYLSTEEYALVADMAGRAGLSKPAVPEVPAPEMAQGKAEGRGDEFPRTEETRPQAQTTAATPGKGPL